MKRELIWSRSAWRLYPCRLVVFFCSAVLCAILSVPRVATAANAQPAGGKPVVFVDGKPIGSADLDAHIAATGLPHDEALDDLINLRLERAAAVKAGLKVPSGRWSDDQRAGIELALAQALSLDIPQGRVSLVVDHAWLKDAEDEADRAAGNELMEKLRELVVAGSTIPAAYEKLQSDGRSWHIGDHEEYAIDDLPDEVRDLLAGSLSPVVPGDGGLHLFKIHQRKEEPPSREEVRGILLDQLRMDATIDLADEEVE
jgi:hypothetical protein